MNKSLFTKKEQIRYENFLAKSKELKNDGYTEKILCVSPEEANIGSLLLTVPLVIILVIVFFIMNPFDSENYNFKIFLVNFFLLYLLFFLAIIAHELIHGLVWVLSCKNWKSISFGFSKAAMAPYCSCSYPLTKAQYITGAFMPTLILGFGLGIASLFIGRIMIMVLSCFLIIGGGGDFLMIRNILKTKIDSKDILYYDHPVEIATVVFYK